MDYINITEAARRLHRSEKTVRRWLHQGKIEHKLSHGQYWLSFDAVAALAPPETTKGDNVLQQQIDALEARVRSLESIVEELQQSPPPTKPKRAKPHPAISRNVMTPQRTGMPTQAPATDAGLLDQFLRRE